MRRVWVCDDPDHPALEVALSANRGAPCLRATPAAVTFPATLAGRVDQARCTWRTAATRR